MCPFRPKPTEQRFCPRNRAVYFGWLDKLPPTPESEHSLIGWFGRIEYVVHRRDDWLVKVNVEPKLHRGGTWVRSADERCSEWYSYKDGRLTFLHSYIPPEEPQRPAAKRKPRIVVS